MLVRIVNMRGVNLSVFDFDYDLTWVGFFLGADENVYGRYGGRDEGRAETYLSLAGLKHAMREALAAHRGAGSVPSAGGHGPEEDSAKRKAVRRAEQYPAAARVKSDCIHCHMVYDFRRAALKAADQWSLEEVWVYPPPKNVGLTMEMEQGNRVETVAADSSAARAKLRPGDVVKTLNALAVASYADVQYALHRAPKAGVVPVTWDRGGKTMRGELVLEEGWRKSDISWRASMWGLEPTASVYGEDLSAEEKEKLGLGPKRLAFRQGDFVPVPARKAGIRAKDIIIGIDDQPLEMTMLQFNVYIRLNFKAGDRVTYNVIRDGRRLDLSMVLEDKDF